MEFEVLLLIVVWTVIFLIMLERIWYEYISPSRRSAFLRKDAHTAKGLFALSEGETIVAVRAERGRLCFYVSNQGKEGKEYE